MALNEQSYQREVGQRVRTLRESRSWSQEKLAREADVSTGTVVKVEAGRTWVSEKTGIALALALDVSVHYIMTGKEKPVPGGAIAYLPQEGADLHVPSTPEEQARSNEQFRALAFAG